MPQSASPPRIRQAPAGQARTGSPWQLSLPELIRRAGLPGSQGGQTGSRARITLRGALLVLLALFLAGDLVSAWLNLAELPGLVFAAGCLLAVCLARRADLLLVVVTPPAVFLLAVLFAEAVTAPGTGVTASAVAVAEGTFLTLAASAPWLFGGLLAALAVAMRRGLPCCLRDLRADLRADRADRTGRQRAVTGY